MARSTFNLPALRGRGSFERETNSLMRTGGSWACCRQSFAAIDGTLAACVFGTPAPGEDLFAYHRNRYQDVATACAAWIASPAPTEHPAAFHAVVQLGMEAFRGVQAATFEINKAATRAGAFVPGASKPMAESYSGERRHFLALKAETPSKAPRSVFSGHWANHEMKQHLDKGELTQKQFAMYGIPSKPFEEMTGEEIMRLEEWSREVGYETLSRVRYLSKDERIRYAVIVRDGRLYQRFDEPMVTPPISSEYSSTTSAIFTMDTYGNLFVSAKGRTDDGYFHHSSHSSGKSVIGAGYIHVNLGVLQALSAFSGHYQPGESDLHAVCLALRAKGVSFANVTIHYWDSGRAVTMKADDFIRKHGGLVRRKAVVRR